MGHQALAHQGLVCLLVLGLLHHTLAGRCELEPPLAGRGGGVAGLVIVPGAHLPGGSYMPLLRAVQAAYPGALWVGATSDWNGDMPTPMEVTDQINKCINGAANMGLDTTFVFMAGHSLGGVVLQSYIATHKDAAAAVAFIGTWLPDLTGSTGSNAYTVPMGTFIGELDGGGISYLRREVEETAALSQEERALSKTVLVPGVNHAQVCSGEMINGGIPEDVIDNDIDPEVSDAEAHGQYGVRVGDWIALQALSLGLLSPEVAIPAVANFTRYEGETAEFLAPFHVARAMEQEGASAEFVSRAQEAILDLAPEDQGKVVVMDEILDNFLFFQGYQPNVEESAGIVRITTYSYLEFDTDILDFNNHLSSSTVKAKMKLADAIYSLLELPARHHVLQCAEINMATLDWAMSVASPAALDRMEAKGRDLKFGQDTESSFGGAGWDYSALKWEEHVGGEMVTLTSTRLTSGVNFPIFSGEHYCDLLSPYRALEWIYIESIRHKMQF